MEGSNIIKMESTYTPNPKGLGWLYYDCMLNNREKLAQIEGLTGLKDTFGQLLERCVRVSLSMKDMGVKHGDVVMTCTLNHLNSCVPIIAATFLGAKISAVDPSLTPNENAQLLKEVPPKIIFVQANVVANIETIGSDAIIVVFGEHPRHLAFTELLRNRSDEADFRPREPEHLFETVSINFSSGTTGPPKGVCHHHYSLMYSSCNESIQFEGQSPLIITYTSPYWALFIGCLNISVFRGLARLVYPNFDPNNAWQMFDFPVTYAFLNVTQMMTMVKQGRPANVRTDSLTDIHIAGDISTEEPILAMKAMFPNTRVGQIYGQTEIFTNITYFNWRDPKALRLMDEKPTSVGLPVPGLWYKIIDVESGAALGPNATGELRVKTKIQTSGYYNRDSSVIWDQNGWLKTGDLAYYDQDFCFYITGRVKEMFKFRGWHVIPSVIEGILKTHSAIENVVVVGVPHEMDGHHPMAMVVLKPSHQSTSAMEITSYLDGKVNDHQRLRGGVKIVPTLPLTATGKVNRGMVRDML